MSMTGEFEDKDGNPFRLNLDVNSAYRLERVSLHPGVWRVPVDASERFGMRAGLGAQSVHDLPKQTIVVGEPGSGVAAFSKWLVEKNSFQRVISIHEAQELIQSASEVDPHNIVLDLATHRQTPSTQRAEQNKLLGMTEVMESSDWTTLKSSARLVVLTRNVDQLRSNPLYSYLGARGHTMRIPHFTANELEMWIIALKTKRFEDTRFLNLKEGEPLKLAKLVKKWTGGQPLLTHYFFLLAEQSLAEPNLSIDDAFVQAGEYLRDHRPHMVAFWLEQLEALKKVGPTIMRTLRGYIGEGNTKNPLRTTQFGDDDVLLFLAGWVGINHDLSSDDTHDERWGIRSECHRAWAASIL